MNDHSSIRNGMFLGLTFFSLVLGSQLAIAQTSNIQAQSDASITEIPTAPMTDETENSSALDVSEYGPIKKGDTLAQIAKQLAQQREVGFDQMTWALYKMNPQAFDQGQLNLLKTGAVLQIPTAAQANAIDPMSARRELNKQASSPTAPRESNQKQAKANTAPKLPDGPAEQLQAQIRETQREREEAAQEHQLLKTRLVEMEKKIRELMLENAERDARLKAQASAAK